MPEAASTPPATGGTLKIGRLTLALSGVSKEESHRVALLITSGLAAAGIANNTQAKVGAVNVRADKPKDEAVDMMADRIVEQILAQIRRAG